MKPRRVFLWIYIASLAAAHASSIINFDDLSPGKGWLLVGSGYEGLEWSSFGVLDGTARAGLDGYGNGTISQRNVAFNLSGSPASFGRLTPFDLDSAYMTSQVASNLHVRVQGLFGTNVVYDNTYAVNPNAPTLINFDYVGIDHVNFIPDSSYIFVLDDVTITVTNSPLPADNFQNVEVGSIGHVFQPGVGYRSAYVRDSLVDQASGSGGVIQPTRANFDTNHQYTLKISAPAGKRFLIRPAGQAASFGGSVSWAIGGNPGTGTGPMGSVTVAFGGLIGTPPDFSGSTSYLSAYHGLFGFYSIISTTFTNDLSFHSITFVANVSSAYTNSGTFNYSVSGGPLIAVSHQTTQTNDPGSFVFLVDQPTLGLHLESNGDVTLTFVGTLESANSVSGPFQDVPGNPQGTYIIPKANLAAQQYFRTRSN